MTRPNYLIHRIICALAHCELDEIYQIMTGHRRCIHCHKPIRPPKIADLNPSAGD